MSLKERIIGFVLFTAILFGTAWTVLSLSTPEPFDPGFPFDSDYRSDAVREALAPGSVEALHDEIEALGSRMLGRPGHADAAEFIADFLAGNGLEVYRLPGTAAAPITEDRSIRLEDGTVMPNVEVFPFPSNSFQPVVSPEEGLTGRLLVLDETTLLKYSDFSDVIGVVRLDQIPKTQDLEWSRYAQMGMKGLVLVHPEGMEAIPWQTVLAQSGMQSILPVNFPRLAATEELLDYAGKRVRLEVKATFQSVDHETVVGVLRADNPTREALVFSVPYDEYGLLPDYARNPLQSYPLATQLALAKGLAAHRDELQRDVIFVTTGAQYIGFAGLDQFLRMIGPEGAAEATATKIRSHIEEEKSDLALVTTLADAVATEGFLQSKETTAQIESSFTPNERNFFFDQLRYVLNTLVFEDSEKVLQSRIDFERGDVFELDRPEYKAFLEAQFRYEDLATAASLPLSRLMDRTAVGYDDSTRFVDVYDLQGALQSRFDTLVAYHSEKVREWTAGLELNRLFADYEELYVFSPGFLPKTLETAGPSELSFVLGGPTDLFTRSTSIIANNVASVVEQVLQETDLDHSVRLKSPANSSAGAIYRTVSGFPVPTSNWNTMGYRAFTFVNTDRLDSYRKIREPWQESTMTANTMADSLDFIAEFALALGKGFGSIKMPPATQPSQYSGTVYVADVGRSLVPNFPLAGALVAPKPASLAIERSPIRYEGMMHFTDPYGRYDLPDASSPFRLGREYNLQSIYYDDNGYISYIKDESSSTQSLYTSIFPNPLKDDFRDVNLVVFRATPVAILDMINPQTLRPFSSIRMIEAGSLTNFDQLNEVVTQDSVVNFLPPDSYFYTTFRSGTADNELVQAVRSYMSGSPEKNPTTDLAIEGEGYLALDHSILQNIPFEQAQSMNRLNETRMELQEAKGLADRHTLEFHEQSGALLNEAAGDGEDLGFFERMLVARDSLTYSIIVHPILRENINGAVVSILWYMALLIPFTFFFEKLVCGFSDIRKQIGAQVVIFLTVFALLRLLHPAFEMIRSSIMILLGFFILLITVAITLLFAGKFRENLEEIKQKRGRVAGAEANSMGVIGTAFMLGLNNMHRRKVRTGLTCLTLVLITFAMICFTSIYSDFEDTEIAVGPANYQGLLVKNEKFAPISATERFAIESRYGSAFPVAPRSLYVGTTNSNNERLNPQLEILHEGDDDRVSTLSFGSIIRLAHNEPLQENFPLITEPYWFPTPDETSPEEDIPVIIPSSMAERLGITVEAVNSGGVPVSINGGNFIVRGIFDENQYLSLKDLDGRPILPFDIRGLRELEKVPGAFASVLGDEDGVLMAPSEILIAPQADLGINVADADNRLVSLALDFDSLSLRQAKEEVVRFLEQRARPAFYGIDGTAYRGSRMRVSDFAGLIDLIIPLIIAALTVLNTMKGSVYERRDEIYVYNAVGIAPRFIFFMFFAEAFVYAVVGCVIGYLLSQGTGTVLTALDLTGDLNMTFASVNSIYASLAVVGAVFLSTYFPARSAMEIAAPSEDSGWDMPEPEGDSYSFNLPFTFDRRERVAVLAFFHRFLRDHGEGGAGGFSAGPPRYEIEGSSKGGPETVVPSVCATVWLKPFDLGVSQELTIRTPFDEETGEFMAAIRLVRSSGTRDSWERVNRPFMVGIRKQFLHWRAVTPEMKSELYEEVRLQLEEQSKSEIPTHA
ncbi:ABC transporter permease [Puniceicoccus vermicola]|uniref:ABC transporter permease n=1 Tax=Puniceicoccus vermicola TaxID=388746 RepID=A0A7X1E4H1_9BACT|nr:ABC transporter permease [Puniceicoccus vermicola]MBC2602540.1 ABC transporter permease [Puniceicoccus vermicola]